ncbi:MAG: DUF99 family protein [Deltaproteobacteria bacterium]|nr:DUF99 family protein [Deltaproteobacteria bacterium]
MSRGPTRHWHVVGIDDAPFARDHRGDVLVVGAVYSGPALHGVLSSKVRRDGTNSTQVLAAMIGRSRFAPQLHAVLLEGIALAGFNVVDIHDLSEQLRLPVVVVIKRPPDMTAIRRALLTRVRGGRRKLSLIEKAGQVEQAGSYLIQRAGISMPLAVSLLGSLSSPYVSGRLPEPLRAAHMIGRGIVLGHS